MRVFFNRLPKPSVSFLLRSILLHSYTCASTPCLLRGGRLGRKVLHPSAGRVRASAAICGARILGGMVGCGCKLYSGTHPYLWLAMLSGNDRIPQGRRRAPLRGFGRRPLRLRQGRDPTNGRGSPISIQPPDRHVFCAKYTDRNQFLSVFGLK